MSTTLQSSLSKNKDIYYVGFNPNRQHLEWFPDATSRYLIDVDLKYSTRRHFIKNLDNYRAYFSKIFHQSGSRLWISSENLMTKFTVEELDPSEKIARLLMIFSDHKVIFHALFRKYHSAVFSMFREYVSRKYSEDFNVFANELVYFEELGCIDHIFPNRFLEHLQLSLDMVHVERQPRLYLYFPDDNKSDITSYGEIANYFPISKENEIILNRSKENIHHRLKFNRMNFNDTHLYNIMETHRFMLAKRSDTFSLDLWSDRRIRNKFLEGKSKTSEWIKEENINIENVKLKDFFLKNHKRCDLNFPFATDVINIGDSENLL